MTQPQTILDFWFGPISDPKYGQPRKVWFVKDPQFDLQIQEQFGSIHQQAARGELHTWQEDAWSCLALIIVLDQFSRHLFRGHPQAFASDPLALAAAQQAIDRGFETSFLPVQRWFLYLPFEHSEDLNHQLRSVQFFERLDQSDPEHAKSLTYAQRHLEVIQRFGRFPHRNSILGRPSTPEEIEFLHQPGSRF